MDTVKVAEAAKRYMACVYRVEVPRNDRRQAQVACYWERKCFDELLEALTGTRALTLAGPALGIDEPVVGRTLREPVPTRPPLIIRKAVP